MTRCTAATWNDKLVDTAGDNLVIDDSGNANITLGDGADIVITGSGNDKIVAGGGANLIDAGDGNNKVTALSGNDSFVFDNLAQGGIDSISDFLTLSDVLVFEDSVFTSLAGGIAAENLVVGAGAVAQDGNDYLIFNTTGGKLYYDADGNGAGAAIQIAALKSVTTLDISNLLIE